MASENRLDLALQYAELGLGVETGGIGAGAVSVTFSAEFCASLCAGGVRQTTDPYKCLDFFGHHNGYEYIRDFVVSELVSNSDGGTGARNFFLAALACTQTNYASFVSPPLDFLERHATSLRATFSEADRKGLSLQADKMVHPDCNNDYCWCNDFILRINRILLGFDLVVLA